MPIFAEAVLSIDTPRITMANGDVNSDYIGVGDDAGNYRAVVMPSGALVIEKKSGESSNWFVRAVIAAGQWVKVD